MSLTRRSPHYERQRFDLPYPLYPDFVTQKAAKPYAADCARNHYPRRAVPFRCLCTGFCGVFWRLCEYSTALIEAVI